MNIDRHALVGSWDLLELEHEHADGVWRAAGSSQGRITYAADGYVTALIIVLPTAEQPERLSDDQLVAYSGRYVVAADGRVDHHIDISARTRWVGSTQTRFAQLEGDELRLVTAPFETASGPRRSRLRWRRNASVPC